MARNDSPSNYEWQLLADFDLAGEPGNKELAADGAQAVAESVKHLHLPKARMERLKTAVKEAVLNLFRRGAAGRPPLPLAIHVFVSEGSMTAGFPGAETRFSSLAAETARTASPAARGWGFFLVEKIADQANLNGFMEKFNSITPPLEAAHHTIEIFIYHEGEST